MWFKLFLCILEVIVITMLDEFQFQTWNISHAKERVKLNKFLYIPYQGVKNRRESIIFYYLDEIKLVLPISNSHFEVYNATRDQKRTRNLCQKTCTQRSIQHLSSFIFNSRKNCLICFGKKENDVEAAVFTKKLLNCRCLYCVEMILYYGNTFVCS